MKTIQEYLDQFDEILNGNSANSVYDKKEYLDYVQMNQRRMKRWYKTGKLNTELCDHIEQQTEPQQWIIITEPWCGDAAHSVPFLHRLAMVNPTIELWIQNRDSEESEIDRYLTNGGKSIPKLIVRNAANEDLFTWGPRPKACQEIVNRQKTSNKPFEEKLMELQTWYNNDNGRSIQEELLEILRASKA